MDYEVLRGFLRIGVLVGGCSFIMIFMQPPGSSEFYVSICSSVIGLVMVLAVVLFMVWLRRQEQ